MPEWRRALAAALIGGVSACIFTVIWGILLLFSGIEPSYNFVIMQLGTC